jgi:predicted ferric reductase
MWLLSLSAGAFAGFWPTRNAHVYYTGILAIGFMSVGVMLAARPVQVESALGGLDKFYRLHKWLGIGAALVALVHWLLEVIPRWMVRQGWLERPRRGGGAGSAGGGPAMFDSFRDWRELAADLGEWSLYLLLILIALALWKRFPYRYFFKTHRLMAAIYLILVFHAIIMMNRSYWTGPIGPVLVLVMVGGSVAALTSLFRRIGHSRRAVGQVEDVKTYADNAVLEVGVRLETAWPGHDAGQFAFVTFDKSEGAHPFTISSGWAGDGRLTFTIKGIGDYTRKLPDLLRVGQAATVEGQSKDRMAASTSRTIAIGRSGWPAASELHRSSRACRPSATRVGAFRSISGIAPHRRTPPSSIMFGDSPRRRALGCTCGCRSARAG